MLKKYSWLWCATLLGAMSSHAEAMDMPSVASGSTMVTGLTYHLVDLDLTDGITPWITFNNNFVAAGARTGVGLISSELRSSDGDLFSAPAVSYTSPDGKLTASYSTAVQSSGIRVDSSDLQNLTPSGSAPIQLDGIAAGVLMGYGSNHDEETGLRSPADGENTWTLSANTALVIDGTAQMKARVDLTQLGSGALSQGVDGNLYTATMTIDALTYIELISGLEGASDSHGVHASQTLALGEVLGQADVQEDGFSFSARLDNTSATSVDGYMDFTTVIFASLTFSPTFPEIPEIPQSPIPEPATWATMALGLALMAWRVKTRRV